MNAAATIPTNHAASESLVTPTAPTCRPRGARRQSGVDAKDKRCAANTVIDGVEPGAAGLAALGAAEAEALRDAAGATDGRFPVDEVDARSIITLAAAPVAPAASTPYYFAAPNGEQITTIENNARFYVPMDCRVKAARLHIRVTGTLGSDAEFEVYFRKNGSTDTLFADSAHADELNQVFPNDDLDIALSRGDFTVVYSATWPSMALDRPPHRHASTSVRR